MTDWTESNILPIGIAIIVVIGFTFLINFAIKESSKEYDLYKETCPKLNATLTQIEKNIVDFPTCHKIVDNEIIYYWIRNVSGEYKLVRKTIH